MDFGKYLDRLAWPILVEAIYLANRYLRHALTRDVFLRQLESDVVTPYREQSAAVVLAIVAAIEAVEGREVRALSDASRLGYASQLGEVIWDRIRRKTDKAEADEALTALRSCG